MYDGYSVVEVDFGYVRLHFMFYILFVASSCYKEKPVL